MRRLSLTQTPIFFEFLKRYIKFMGYKNIFDFDMEKELFLTGYCRCKQKDCATVYLKRIQEWEEEYQTVNIVSTKKGIILIHIEENGFMEFEALEYKKYPYQTEIIKVFQGKKSTLTQKDILKLDQYFDNLELECMNTIVVDLE